MCPGRDGDRFCADCGAPLGHCPSCGEPTLPDAKQTLRNRGEPAGFSKLAAPLMAIAMRHANRKDLRNLRAILEAR